MRITPRKPILLLGAAAIVAVPMTARFAVAAPPIINTTPLVQELEGTAPAQARSTAEWATAYAGALDSLLPDMSSVDLKQRAAAEAAWEKIALRAGRPGAAIERQAACQAMIARLGAGTPQNARVWLIKQLAATGGAEAATSLAGLLNDKDPLIQESARRALQTDTSDQALQALQAALKTAETPAWRIALINAIGARRDASSAPAILPYLRDDDPQVAQAAATALAWIGTPAGLDALSNYKGKADHQAVINARLLGAEHLAAVGDKTAAASIYRSLWAPGQSRLVRIAALHGLVLSLGDGAIPQVKEALADPDAGMQATAAGFVNDMPGSDVARTFADALTQFPEGAQIALIGQLAQRGDPAAEPAIAGLATGQDEPVRMAAVKALGDVGSASDVPLLLKTAAGGPGGASGAARMSLARLKGNDVGTAVQAFLLNADPHLRAEAARSLGVRHETPAIDALVKAMADPDAQVQSAALTAVGLIGDEKQVPVLVQYIVNTHEADARDAGSSALVALCGKAVDKAACGTAILAAWDTAGSPARQDLLPALAQIGGDAALARVRASVKDSNVAVQDSAVRTLAMWPDQAAASDLLDLARNASARNQRILALRGYLRLAGSATGTPGARLQMIKDGLALATGTAEKRLALSDLARVFTADALDAASPFMDDKPVAEDASAAVVTISQKIASTSRTDVKAALQHVLVVSKNKKVRQDASRILARLSRA